MKVKNAYLTVEAALVMPIVLGVIVLTIFLLFFQYDRCILEQDMGVLAMRGCTLQAVDQNELAEKLYDQIQGMDAGRYLAWDKGQVRMTMKGGQIAVEQTGALRFPLGGLQFWNGGGRWEASAKYRNHRIAPMKFIRNCRRVMGGK